VEVCFALVLKTSGLEARAVTLYVFRISEHTGSTHVLFVLAPVLWPLCHIIKASGKLFALNPFNVLFAAATDNFNCFGSRVKHCHWHLLNQLNRCRFPNFLPEQARSGFGALLTNRCLWGSDCRLFCCPGCYDVAKASSKKGELPLLLLLVFPSLPALELDVYHCAAVAAV
jgi:hypothetical protein